MEVDAESDDADTSLTVLDPECDYDNSLSACKAERKVEGLTSSHEEEDSHERERREEQESASEGVNRHHRCRKAKSAW